MAPAPYDPLPRAPPLPSPVAPRLDLLEVQELARARMFALLAVGLPLVVLLVVPFLGGDRGARDLFVASLCVTAASSAWLLWSLREDARYDVGRLVVVGSVWLVGALAALHFFGVFSPAVVLLPLGVFFFGLTRDGRVQSAAYLATAASYFVMAAPALHPAAHDRASLAAAQLARPQALLMVAVVELVLLVTFVHARAARAAALVVLARNERTSSAILQKDAQIAELQKDLARALDVAGVGRFSETTVGGYKLGDVIGRGAMGEVYEAVDRDTLREVAVKVLHAHTLKDPALVESFLREGTMAQAVETPHAVRIVEVGGFEGELPFLVMERLRGEDLAEHLRHTGRLNLPDVLRLLAEVGAGLTAARQAGVVHRDVKPRNLFLSRDERGESRWKLLDFGVAKGRAAQPGSNAEDSGDGRVVGTPEYMAPEQAAGGNVTHRSDLFSLAAVIYRALTGSSAFAGDHIAEVLYRIGHAMPTRPSALVDVTPETDLVLALALAKSPDDRFGSAEEFRDALADASRGVIRPERAKRAQQLLSAMPWDETLPDSEP